MTIDGKVARVLIVDDSPEFRGLLGGLVEQAGYAVELAEDGPGALKAARTLAPDLVVLDLNLPGMDGIEVCRSLRTFSDAYVIMLTARTEETDKLVGLAVGADDYVTKPFSPRELLARIQARLRRPRTAEQSDSTRRRFGDLTLNPAGREVKVGEDPVSLTRIEFDIIETLTSRPEMVFSRELLRDRVWGPNWYGSDHVIDVHVGNLRRKIDPEDGPSYVKTVRGVGYRFQAP